MSIAADRQIVIVLGKTGHGKSVWTRQYVAGKPRLFVADPLASYRVEWLDHDALLDRHDYGDFAANKKFRAGSFQLDDVELIGSLAFVHGNNTLVLEEASTLFEKGGRLPPWASQLVFLGRHQAASIVITAQRAASIPIEFRSQAHRVVTFAQSEGDDIKWLKPWLGDHLAELPGLPRLVCIDSNGSTVSRYKITY